jgi:hypothetical protein
VEGRSIVVRIFSEFSLFFFCMGSYEELYGGKQKKIAQAAGHGTYHICSARGDQGHILDSCFVAAFFGQHLVDCR